MKFKNCTLQTIRTLHCRSTTIKCRSPRVRNILSIYYLMNWIAHLNVFSIDAVSSMTWGEGSKKRRKSTQYDKQSSGTERDSVTKWNWLKISITNRQGLISVSNRLWGWNMCWAKGCHTISVIRKLQWNKKDWRLATSQMVNTSTDLQHPEESLSLDCSF